MAKKRGRLAKPIDPSTKDKMITIRIDGELYNAIVRAAGLNSVSLNSFISDILAKQELINITLQWIKRENQLNEPDWKFHTETALNILKEYREKQNGSTDTSTTPPIHS